MFSGSETTPAVALQAISVRFGQVAALSDVTVQLAPGSRHAIVGENGAGKSTLMKVLFGLLMPDAGQVLLNGSPQRFQSPKDAITAGIGMVQQHFELVGPLTVWENVTLGAEVAGPGGVLRGRDAADQVRRLADESGLPIDPNARVQDLSVAAQQRVEILKALYRRARVLILDEPTATLAPSEARDLWAASRRLSEAGTTVVFITHKLDDVMAHADEVTVLRRGRHVYHAAVRDTSPGVLAQAMIGEAPSPVPSPAAGEGRSDRSSVHGADATLAFVLPSPAAGEGASLRVAAVTVRGRRGETVVDGASLDVRGGEIVGLAGVDGSGQVELIEAVLGLRAITAGEITLGGETLNRLSVAQRRARGVGYVPEDRHHRALVLPFGCEENAVLGRQREAEFSRRGLMRSGKVNEFLTAWASRFDVRGGNVGTPARSLSGGNQQKLVMAREISRQPKVLLAAQPTRGLDFAASAFVHDALRAERDRGAAVLVQSLDLGEVLALSDRVAVMLRGKVVAVLSKADATEARVGALMTGAET